MGLHKLLVDNVDPGRCNHAREHVLRLVKKVTIVNVSVTSKGHDQCRFATAARSTAALRIVCWRWRHITQMDD